MKNIKLQSLLTLSLFVSTAFATDYDNAKFDNYISDQGVNEVLSEAQEIICLLSRMGTEQLAGDGSYKAVIYADECEEVGAASTDSTAGTTAPTSATTSSSSGSTATAGAEGSSKDIVNVVLNSGFTSSDLQSTKGWIINDKPWDDRNNNEPKNIMYLLNEQSAAVSDTNKFGNFTLRYQLATFGNTQEDLPEWYTCPDPNSNDYQYSWCADGADLGRGILVASGGLIKFKSDTQGSAQQNVVAEYYDNGDIAGIYSRSSGFMDESLRDDSCDEVAEKEDGTWDHDAWWECQPDAFKNSNVNILGIFAFGISSDSKTYCTVMSELFEVDWSVYNEETDGPTLKPYVLTDAARSNLGDRNSWDTEEKCFSINKSDAIKNIWDYGVFNSDGSTLTTENQSFPIKALVDVDGKNKRVNAYASYWGVWVDDEYQPYVTETTEWTRDGQRDSSADSKYNLKVKTIEVDKREKTFSSLNNLDGIGFRFWVNDSHWTDEYQKLGFPKIEPWEGSIKFKTNKASFTDYNNGSSSEPVNYGLYGYFAGKNTYVADLVGASLDRDNINKIIANDPNDPGKAMNLTMEFAEFPSYDNDNDWNTERFIRIYLCNRSFDPVARSDIYDISQLGLTDGQCLKVEGMLKATSDGKEMVLSSKNDNSYGADFYDISSNTQIGFNRNNLNNNGDGTGNEYDFKLTLDGLQRPSGMEVKLQELFTRLGGLSQFDNDGGDIESGLNAFANSSDNFTFLMQMGYQSVYDHEGNRFEKVMGRFNVSDTPSLAIFVDDVMAIEGTSATTLGGVTNDDKPYAFPVFLSKVASSDVTLDYVISDTSTASSDDYTDITNGTVTIPAGSSTATIPFTVIGDAKAEGQIDEKIVLTLSNPTNAVLGRASAVAYIYDNDANRIIYNDYYGSFDSETQTFTITEGLSYEPEYLREDLPAPIVFTTTEWINSMVKVWGLGEEWEFSEYRDLNGYSDDTNQDYTITREAMLNPTLATKDAGISTTKWSRVSVTDLPSTLYCIQECLNGANLNTHYADVKSQADPDNDFSYSVERVPNASPSPYADVGPYIKNDITITRTYNEGTEDEWSDVEVFEKGRYADGIIQSDVFSYTVSDGVLTDKLGNIIKTGVDWGVSRPSELIRGARFKNPEGNWERETHWGINTGTLVESTSLQYLECEYSLDDNGNKEYNEFQPEYTAENGKKTETRYCVNKLWGNDDILVSYNVSVRLENQYDIFNSDGSKLVLDPPKALYFRAPNDESKFGSDADKKFRLDYHGDHLGGIPGNVINIETGEVLGEWVEEWKDEYRWVQRFQIPDGSKLTDGSGVEYLVKALAGEEWLGKKDSAIGSLSSLLSSKSATDLLNNKDVNWEISQRKDRFYDCNLTKEFTDTYTYTDDDGVEQTDTNTYTGTDWDACNELEYDSVEWNEAWSITASFDNCNEKLDFWYNERSDQIAQEKANSGSDYSGPNSPEEDENFMEWFGREQDRCKAIGPVPTSLINNGDASVINGDVVFDPTR